MGINFGGLLNYGKDAIPGVITILSVCIFILLANIMRRKIPFFRRSLMPTAVIAGLIGLLIKEVILQVFGFNIFNEFTLSEIVYHTLPVGFIALSLREKNNYENEFDKSRIKTERVAATKSGAVIISTYLLQAIIGIAATVLIGLFVLPELNKAVGIILPLGFGQGPQQASATGMIWDAPGAEYLAAWGNGSARNFGLTIAALGFLWSSIAGIILVNRIAKKRGITIDRDYFQKSGDVASYRIEGPDEVPLSESIDKFTLQICMIGGVYLLTIGLILLLELGLSASGIAFLIDLVPTIWGFGFMIAVLVAIIVKNVLRRLVKTGVMHRKYPNSYMMNRISGAAFDLSITSALFMISVLALGTLWIPVLVITALGGFASIFYIKYISNFIFKNYKDEAFLAFFGMLTGTIANGMILTREIDKNFETPAADDLVAGSAAAIILAFPLLLLVAQAPKQGNLWWVTLILAGYLSALLIYLLKDKFFKKKA